MSQEGRQLPCGARKCGLEKLFIGPMCACAARVPSWISPDLLSWSGGMAKFLMGALGLHAFKTGTPMSFMVLVASILFAWLCDSLDGPLARHRGLQGPPGFLLDHCLDLLTMPAWIIGAYSTAAETPHPSSWALIAWQMALLLHSSAENYWQAHTRGLPLKMDAVAGFGLLDVTVLYIVLSGTIRDFTIVAVMCTLFILNASRELAGKNAWAYILASLPALYSPSVGIVMVAFGIAHVALIMNHFVSSMAQVPPLDSSRDLLRIWVAGPGIAWALSRIGPYACVPIFAVFNLTMALLFLRERVYALRHAI